MMEWKGVNSYSQCQLSECSLMAASSLSVYSSAQLTDTQHGSRLLNDM